jgi:outer membrane receptor for ferrienterochelin and colicins
MTFRYLPAGALIAFGLHPLAHAQTAVSPAAAASQAAPTQPATSATQLKRVEVSGARTDDTLERRESTAAKIVIGREEIERYGDSNLGDVLKRLPGVTMQGRPGRGGNIRMRGLGNGYTQILLDGQRIPPGFSLDSLTPEQVERIEILRAPTAETGARAIAGTINIITREGFVKHINDLRITAAAENGRLQPNVSWTRNDAVGAFTYNYVLSAFGQDRDASSSTTTVDQDLSTGAVTLNQRDDGTVREKRHGLHASGRLQWRDEGGANTVTLMPLLIYSTGPTDRTGVLTQTVGATPAPYDHSLTHSDGTFTLARLNGQWNQRLADGARLEWKAGLGQAKYTGTSLRTETTGGVITRTLTETADNIDNNLLLAGTYRKLLTGDHNLVTGAEVEALRRTEDPTTLQTPTPLQADLSGNFSASSTRVAAFAQDEWALSPQWAAHAGLRWEGIKTRSSGDANNPATSNTSSVWTPLAHAVWRPTPESRDQVRFSLTRSYRSPTLQNLIARPSINNRYPAPGPNTPTQADRAGNPNLRPELASGLDVAYEHYLGGGGLVSANVFHRSITNFMRSVTALETVSWSPTNQRYVARMQNVGDAITQGVELEAKFRLSEVMSEVMADAPKLDLRTNLSFFRSRVQGVAGPDNRLDQQPDYTANIGLDYRLPGLPLTLGGNLNWTPAYNTRISDEQSAFHGRKVQVDAYALWVFNPSAQLRLTASNIGPRDYITASNIDTANVRETSANTAPTYLNFQVKLEFKL